VIAGASYTVEGLRWLPDGGQPGDIIIEFSDPHASQSLGNAAEAVTLTLITDRGQVTCIAAADSDRRFFASGQTGPETGAALGDCGQKFRLLADQAEATILERAHRRRRRQYVPVHHTPVDHVSVEPAGECDDECEYSGNLMYGGSDSCQNRVDWILGAGQPVHVAYEIVNEACAGQCFCSLTGRSSTESSAPSSSPSPAPTPAPTSATTPAPTAAGTPAPTHAPTIAPTPTPAAVPAPTAAPTSGGGCDASCDYNGGLHSCRDRISWLVNHGGQSAATATS